MSTDTPTPERVTLTDEEQEDLREAIDADETWRDDCDECDNAISDDHHLLATVETILAAREQALREEIADLSRWKDEALPVLDGLQEIGRALDLPLGERITGPVALAAVERLVTRGGAR